MVFVVSVSAPDQPAAIVTHPQDQSVSEGEAVTFTVGASGTEPLYYQWQRWGTSAWEDIGGAIASSYTLSDALYPEDDGALFRCFVSNAVTPAGVYSDPATLTVAEVPYEYFDDFGGYAAGSDPVGWLDTGANNSMVANDSLFKVYEVGGQMAFGTTSTLSDIHSHYVGASYDAGVGFVFTGRMRMSAASSGIGVTFLSDYANTDTYYRLRRFSTNAFHLAPHGTAALSGVTDSGVVPVANTWYWFKIEVVDTDGRTEIRAKVWAEGSVEPAGWQIDAWDGSAGRLTSGRIGVWGYSSGSKYWDDLAVEMLAPVNQPPVADGTVAPLAGVAPLAVDFDASGSYDPDGAIELYEWDFDGDGVYDFSSPTTGSTSHEYTSVGTYVVTLRVTDDEGATGSMVFVVSVSAPNQPAGIVTHPQDQSVSEGEAVTFTVGASGTEPLYYQWQRWGTSAWEDIGGAVASSYTLSEALYPEDDGALFRCFVSNAVTPAGVYSDPATLTVAEVPYEYFDDFGGYAAGSDPVGWLDTGANNSMVANDSLFKVYEVGGQMAFGTTSTLSDIHSHYVGASYDAGVGFVFTGRMRMSAASSGIGVTFLSDYANTDTYYRLRRFSTNAFHLAPHGTAALSGDIESGVVPVVNTWYWFKIEVVDTGSRTEIRANVWAEGSVEPAGWQIDAWDGSAGRLTSGRIGVWGYSSGSKYWDDLMVTLLSP
jgi:PKD repeat protein